MGRSTPGCMWPRRQLVLAAVLFCSLWFGVSRAQLPLGRVVWTQRTVGTESPTFTVHTRLFVPDPRLSDLVNDGELKVDQNYLMLITETEVTGSTSAETLSADGSLPAQSPKATLRFMQPVLDYTGKRVVFAAGDTWGPELTETQARAVTGGTALYYGVENSTRLSPSERRFTDPPGAGEGYDAYPVVDPEGRYVYFSRFHYRRDGTNPPGWYLMRTTRAAAEGASPGSEEYLEADGERIQGYQPVLDSHGRYLFFVRPDPNNIGSDIWVSKLDPDPLTPEKFIYGEGEDALNLERGGDREPWVQWARFKGKARISRPTISSDGKVMVYASDRDGDWDLYSMELSVDAIGELEARNEQLVIPRASPDVNDATDEMWPSISGDGRFVAFMSNRSNDGTGRLDGGRTRIWTVGVEAGGGPTSGPEIVADTPDEQLWPVWDQDDDPPHLLIVLHTSGGAEPTKILIQDRNPDPLPDPTDASAPPTDHTTLAIYLPDYYPNAPPPGEGTDLPPIHFGFPNQTPPVPEPVRVIYDLDDAGMGDTGYNYFASTDDDRGHGFHLLLSGKRDELGLHRGFNSDGIELENLGSETGPGKPSTLKDENFDGIYLFENQRLGISVYARDNRWLRVAPTDDVRDYYSSDLMIEEAQIEPRDPRALPNGPAKPPYLKILQPEEIMGGKRLPGVAWWIEEGPRDGTNERDMDPPRHKNAAFVIFRFANYFREGEPVDESRNKDIFLRVVARDLLGNITDVRIPLHVRDKDFEVNSITQGTQRDRRGP